MAFMIYEQWLGKWMNTDGGSVVERSMSNQALQAHELNALPPYPILQGSTVVDGRVESCSGWVRGQVVSRINLFVIC
jgi:hypothetical protein